MQLSPIILIAIFLHAAKTVVYPDIDLSNTYGKQFQLDQAFAQSGTDIPVLKVLKRHVRNFVIGKTPAITIVYYASLPTQVRWFKRRRTAEFLLSEITNMMPLQDNDFHKITNISSGLVQASRLTLPGWWNDFDQDFETILSTENGMLQYQLRTTVTNGTAWTDDIDSPEWLIIPRQYIAYSIGKPLHLICHVLVPRDNSTSSTKAYIEYINFNLRHTDSEFFDIVRTGLVTSKGQSWDNGRENSTLEIINRRRDFGGEHSIYEMILTTNKSDPSDTGIYQFLIDKGHEKTYLTSSVSANGGDTSKPLLPIVDFVPCWLSERTKSKVFDISHLNQTCIRCRSIASVTPWVWLVGPNGEEIMGDRFVSVDKYVNVADGGVAEAAYTFLTMSSSYPPNGNYSCEASNSFGKAVTYFVLTRQPLTRGRLKRYQQNQKKLLKLKNALSKKLKRQRRQHVKRHHLGYSKRQNLANHL